jgi:6-phosphofructokinase 1
MNTVIEMVDRLRDTCESHARCSVIEVMGRGAGDIALFTGIATGATAIVIPEIETDVEAIIKKIENSRRLGKRNFIILVSEGVGSKFGPELTETIETRTGIESRFTRLGHVVRGGNPSLRDRFLASRMGVYAVDRLLEGLSNIVVCDIGDNLTHIEINYALILDRMCKGKLKEGDLDVFTPEQIAQMEETVRQKKAKMARLYYTADRIDL